MITFIAPEGRAVTVPEWVTDIDSFRRWSDSDDFPENTNTWWLRGEVWVDMSKEQIFTHIRVKTVITSVLNQLVDAAGTGLMLADGLLLSNFAADISGNPDLTYISHDRLESEEVRLIEGRGGRGGYTEVQGSPDMVLEVLSDSSVRKDTVILRQGYWTAGVTEYWLVDARSEPLTFDILRHAARGYVAARKQGGWVKSAVFGKSFRLVQGVDARKLPTFRLETR